MVGLVFDCALRYALDFEDRMQLETILGRTVGGVDKIEKAHTSDFQNIFNVD